jgi:PAS domain S-box-containing protein
VAVRRQKSLVLILAREFASQLAMPMFIVDANGDLVFWNEPAERILGQTFAEAGEMSGEELADTFEIANLAGELLDLPDRQVGIALLERRPTHARNRIRGVDGIWRTVSVTAFPLLTGGDEFSGVVAMFWEEPEEVA